MAVRAKLVVQEITESVWGGGAKTVTLRTQYDETIPEDQRFFSSTPTGEFKMLVNNPLAIEQLRLGQAFYLDLTPVAGS